MEYITRMEYETALSMLAEAPDSVAVPRYTVSVPKDYCFLPENLRPSWRATVKVLPTTLPVLGLWTDVVFIRSQESGIQVEGHLLPWRLSGKYVVID